MQGANNNDGIVKLAARDMLRNLSLEEGGNGIIYELHAQFIEIYNEQIRDLLSPPKKEENGENEIVGRSHFSLPQKRRNNTTKRQSGHLVIREERQADGSLSVTLPHAKQIPIRQEQDVVQVLEKGNAHRASAATALNANSSRSHAIFRLLLTVRTEDSVLRHTVLNLVDLAGSENSHAAITSGLQKRETGKINQSLLALSRVIHALSLPPKKRPKHIGYRDSKLTRMLQPHLSGNAGIAVLCCVSTARCHLEETRSALKFAASAKRIQVQPIIHESRGESTDQQQALLLSLQKELQETKRSLALLQRQLDRSRQSPMAALSHMKPPDDAKSSRTERKITISETLQSISSYHGHVFHKPISIGNLVEYDRGDRGTAARIQNADDSDGSSEAGVILDPSGELNASLEITSRVLGEGLFEPQSDMPIQEVTIMLDSSTPVTNPADQLEQAQVRAKYLADKLEATDDLVESLFHDLRDERSKNGDLLQKLEILKEKIGSLEEEIAAKDTDFGSFEQQVVLLKYGISIGLALFMCGQGEGFLVTVLILWLTLSVAKVSNE